MIIRNLLLGAAASLAAVSAATAQTNIKQSAEYGLVPQMTLAPFAGLSAADPAFTGIPGGNSQAATSDPAGAGADIFNNLYGPISGNTITQAELNNRLATAFAQGKGGVIDFEHRVSLSAQDYLNSQSATVPNAFGNAVGPTAGFGAITAGSVTINRGAKFQRDHTAIITERNVFGFSGFSNERFLKEGGFFNFQGLPGTAFELIENEDADSDFNNRFPLPSETRNPADDIFMHVFNGDSVNPTAGAPSSGANALYPGGLVYENLASPNAPDGSAPGTGSGDDVIEQGEIEVDPDTGEISVNWGSTIELEFDLADEILAVGFNALPPTYFQTLTRDFGTFPNIHAFAVFSNGVDEIEQISVGYADEIVDAVTYFGFEAPDGYFLQSILLTIPPNNTRAIFTGIDDLAFVSNQEINATFIPEPSALALLGLGGLALALIRRRR